jgi:hypothetical protein
MSDAAAPSIRFRAKRGPKIRKVTGCKRKLKKAETEKEEVGVVTAWHICPHGRPLSKGHISRAR